MFAPQERGTMKSALKRVSQSPAGLAAVVVLAVLVVVLAVLGRGMLRWIIDSGDRSDRTTDGPIPPGALSSQACPEPSH